MTNTTMMLSVSVLDSEIDISEFDCGNPSINNLLKEAYWQHILHQGTVYKIKYNNRIIGYYMFEMFGIWDDDYQSSFMEGRFAGIKLKFICIDSKYQNNKIGTRILKSIIEDITILAANYPIRYFALDSLIEKYKWYEKHGFYSLIDVDKCTNPTISMYIDFVDRNLPESV